MPTFVQDKKLDTFDLYNALILYKQKGTKKKKKKRFAQNAECVFMRNCNINNTRAIENCKFDFRE